MAAAARDIVGVGHEADSSCPMGPARWSRVRPRSACGHLARAAHGYSAGTAQPGCSRNQRDAQGTVFAGQRALALVGASPILPGHGRGRKFNPVAPTIALLSRAFAGPAVPLMAGGSLLGRHQRQESTSLSNQGVLFCGLPNL